MFSKRTWQTLASLLVIGSAVLAACTPAASTPQVIRETQVVTQIVAGTAQTVIITATPAPVEPTAAPEKDKVLRINIGTYPDIVDPQKSSFVNEIAHLKLIYEGLTTFDASLQTVPGAAEKW
jgi:oligopeptide transport system substrate-binding protein